MGTLCFEEYSMPSSRGSWQSASTLQGIRIPLDHQDLKLNVTAEEEQALDHEIGLLRAQRAAVYLKMRFIPRNDGKRQNSSNNWKRLLQGNKNC
jgi:hypothetical protein